jgi:ribosomal protein L2
MFYQIKKGEHRLVSSKLLRGWCNSHDTHFYEIIKQRYTTSFGIRPRTRPSAMNPVDHPMVVVHEVAGT